MKKEAVGVWEDLIRRISRGERTQVLEKTPDYLARFYSKIPEQARIYLMALYLFVKNESFRKTAPAIAALLYFIMPLDVMPDFLPLLGFADDIAVLQATLRYLHREIQPYMEPARSEVQGMKHEKEAGKDQEGSDILH